MADIVVNTDRSGATGDVSHDDTIGHEPAITDTLPAGERPPTPSRTASLVRTSILPRVKRTGGAPALVHVDAHRYERVKALGEGGVGEVALARDNDIQRLVALKQLKSETKDDHGSFLRFIDEIQTIGQLEHPSIVPIHDVGVDENGAYFFVMKYVEGETLETVIERLDAGDGEAHATYTFARRTEIFLQILRAVEFAHARGIVHRDIKPSNVMIGRFGEVMVMDWGLAKRVHEDVAGTRETEAHEVPFADTLDPKSEASGPATRERLFRTRHGSLLGTPGYMAPEQARGENDAIDARSDIYSLSALYFELVLLRHYIGARPTLPEMLHAVMHDKPKLHPLSHAHQGSAPASHVHTALRGLEKDPKRRFQSVREMAQEIENTVAGKCAVHCHVTLVKRVTGEIGRFVDRSPRLGVMLFLAAVSLVLYGGVRFIAALVAHAT